MGYRGGSSEVSDLDRWVARRSPAIQRRTSPWFWCGVLFFATLPACTASDTDSATRQNVLTLGFSEGGTANAERLGQLATIFTLEGLTQESVDARARPRLARSWSWENNFLSLRLNLQPGVTFHDGTPFTSAVAAEALSRAIARPGNLALYPSFSDIRAVRPDGDLQLVLDLSQPSAFLPEDLEVPLSVGAQNAGTGPFRLASTDSSGAVLQRFERYDLGAPHIEQIIIRPYTLRTAWTSLLRGDVDMVTDVPPQTVEFIRNDDIQVMSFARRYQFLIAFNSQKPPFTSAAVRRALNASVNRDALITNVLQGKGEAATGPLWPKHWAYDTSIQSFGFDPQVAMSLLDAVGLRPRTAPDTSSLPPARFHFTCLLPADFTLLERIGLEVQKQLYDVGVDMQFEVVPFQEYDSRIREGRFEAVLVDMISGPTFERPFIFWRSARESRYLNVFGYENAEAERLFQVLRRSTNEAALRSAAYRLQRVLMEDPPALFLVWNERTRAVRRHFRIAGDSDRDPLRTIWQWTENSEKRAASR